MVDRIFPSFGNTTLYYLPLMHASQSNESVGQEICQGKIPLTIFCSVWTSFTFKWPRWWCQSLSVSYSDGDLTKLATFDLCIFIKFICTWFLCVTQSQLLHYNCKMLQCIPLGWIGPSNRLKYFSLPKINWHTIWTCKTHL